jgi:hypothetical protein
MRRPEAAPEFGPWNPGIQSQLPRAYLPLGTLFRPENVSTTVSEALELADFTGLPPETLVRLRPERLVLHEILVRLTADYSVPDGERIEDLGINFRRMVADAWARLADEIDGLTVEFAELQGALQNHALTHLADSDESARSTPGFWQRFLSDRPKAPPIDLGERDESRLAAWRDTAGNLEDPVERAALIALAAVAEAVRARRGALIGEPALLAKMAANLASNDYGGQWLGERLAPMLARAAESLGFRRLPIQARPVVMNIKGASASGKSTMRPLHKRLAAEIGVDWADFALISPDIWRKYLLDYESLGEAYKYAGTLTGEEVHMIDKKLDRYMAYKAETRGMTHLLIDRFRFDSFAIEPDEEEGSRLLTRFGALVYMFFMITPPEATVERAWSRGLAVGRYKAVDDLLYHNVEAFTGMPRLFFTWALKPDKAVHFEFLDNSVPLGERPRTVAFGWNDRLTVLDVKTMLDIERFRKINLDAKRPEDVYPNAIRMAPENNTGFLRDCAERLRVLEFLDPVNGGIYARFEAGRLIGSDHGRLGGLMNDPEIGAALKALTADNPMEAPQLPDSAVEAGFEDKRILGQRHIRAKV